VIAGELAVKIEEILKRQDLLMRNAPRCQCTSEQVQLIDNAEPAEWKCRKCKMRFRYEPKCREGL
jgi:hypothetical protein